ncbi:hypothetical protein BUALT_Bualt01G0176600 [Buddleja alternifolia]|uniref:DC1 domain-containing protein n=1 Tax=Buddleja alternifolia TaxID=168488 RepID=A0AAV6YIE2_9LAMI|nr:hypothetical protein BUALT_Bualt01G0176600 [Buddleja alternifolia]
MAGSLPPFFDGTKMLQLNEGEQINCKACEDQISEPFHGCLSCNFYLHDSCIDAPRSLDHLSHPSHPLTLLPAPTYLTRSFTCNACGLEGKAFSFCCARCEVDIHVQCACMPKTLLIKNHHHELELIFGSPYEDKSTVFACDVCEGIMNPDHWLYYCRVCDFGAHLGCTDGKDARKVAKDDQDSRICEINCF